MTNTATTAAHDTAPDTRLGVSLHHPLTGEVLFDGGSGPEVEANQAAFAKQWEEMGFYGSPAPRGPRPRPSDEELLRAESG